MNIYHVGLDPEVAIVDKKTGVGRSAHMFIDKKEEFKFYYDRDIQKTGYSMLGSEVARDGAAVEVRSMVKSACRDNIIPYVAEALRQTELKISQASKGRFTLSSTPKFTLDKESLVNPPEDVVEFGCRPDIDAYVLSEKNPFCQKGDLRRWTGGHLHASPASARGKMETQAGWAILFDYVVTAPFVAILGDAFAEGEAERRELYGQPGSFRFDEKLDKIEFRTLSGRVLLHPTLLYWAIGAMKMMGLQTSNPMELVKTLRKSIPTEFVYDTVMSHNVAQARDITAQIFKLLPKYSEDKSALANPLSGGGRGTYNPFFFQEAANVFIAANDAGVTFKDDMVWNWGLYEDYVPKHHSYWGIQQAMTGLLDDDIFPMNAVLPKLWPNEFLAAKPNYTHPVNGGAQAYVTPGAAKWLA